MSDNRQAIESNPSHAFSGFCQFIDWWTEFQRLYCQGIESTWSANGADHFVRFRFQKGMFCFIHTLDLKDADISQAMVTLQLGLLKLRLAPSLITNESES